MLIIMSFVLLIHVMMIWLTGLTHGTINDIKIGGIFSLEEYHSSDKNTDFLAFSLAVDFINDEENRSGRFGFRFVKEIELIDVNDDLDNMLKAMDLVNRGCVAITGPTEIENVKSIQELCHKLQTPQIIPFESGYTLYNPCEFEFLLRMSPGDSLLFNAVADVIAHFNWTQVSALASRDDEGRSGENTLKQLLYQRNIKLLRYDYFYVSPHVIRASLRRILLWIKALESRVIILKSRTEYVRIVMEVAEKMEMVDGWIWVLVDDQLDEANLVNQGNLQGMIGVRQSVGQGLYSNNIIKYIKDNGHRPPLKPSSGRIIDSVLLLAEAVRIALKDGVSISSTEIGNICNHTNEEKTTNNQGVILSRYLRKVHIDGYMGRISLGEAITGSYDIVNLYNDKVTKVGQWTSQDKLVISKDTTIKWGRYGSLEIPRSSYNILANKTITIVTFKSPPFIIPKHSNITDMQTGDDFEGAVIDILNKLSRSLHFNYVIYMSPDSTVGNYKASGSWGGAIGEVMAKKADLAIGPITITSHRSKVVDFTHPFMTSGLGVVMATKEVPPAYFGFLKPFHKELWVTIIGSVIVMAVVSWLFSVISPNGYYGRCKHGLKTEIKMSDQESKYNLSFPNAVWSSAAYYLGQGPDGLHPVSASGRISIAVWWFCITILASTYTANLAAYLTTNRMQLPISTVQDLSQQNEIDYGLVANSQTQTFFEDSHVSRYQIMWEYMKLRRGVVSNYTSGIQRVLTGSYAFIHDAPVLQYSARKHYCGYMKLIGGFDHGTIGQMNYGFAMHKNSPIKTLINVEMLKMQHSGEIKRMIKKWMVDNTPCSPLDNLKDNNESTDTSKMGVMNMLGVFILMLAGVVIGFVLLILEWFVAALGDRTSTGNLPLSKALKCRSHQLLKHFRNPQAMKFKRKYDHVSFTATKATQTSSTDQNIKNSSYEHSVLSTEHHPSSTSRTSRHGKRYNLNERTNTADILFTKKGKHPVTVKNSSGSERNSLLSTSRSVKHRSIQID